MAESIAPGARYMQLAQENGWIGLCDPSLAFRAPELHELACQWRQARGDGVIPRRADFTARSDSDESVSWVCVKTTSKCQVARAHCGRGKSSVTSGAARFGFVVGQEACVPCGIVTIFLIVVVCHTCRVRLTGALRFAE